MRTPQRNVMLRIQRELLDLDRTVNRAIGAWRKAPTSVDQDVYVDSAALHLQSFYTGLEGIFKQIAQQLDGNLPEGESWHLELIQQMDQTIPGRRPPLLSQKTIRDLDEFRRFRHVVRNVYATNLDPAKMENLFRVLPALWAQLRAELLAFAEFLALVEGADE